MIKIVGKMQDGKPVIFDNPIDKPVEVDDVLLNEDGEYLRVIHNGQRLSSVVLPDVQNPKDYDEAEYYEAALQEIDEAAHGWSDHWLNHRLGGGY